MSPENASCLTAAKIDVCTLANNHIADWGVPGLLETLATLERLGIAYCGAGRRLDEAIRPAVTELGDRTRVVVFSIGCVEPACRRGGPPGRLARVSTSCPISAMTRSIDFAT